MINFSPQLFKNIQKKILLYGTNIYKIKQNKEKWMKTKLNKFKVSWIKLTCISKIV